MVGKLKHKIIVFTGAIASGKTTVKKTLQDMLGEMKIPYCEISGINDLYLPFGVQKKVIKKKKSYKRFETTLLMENLYSQYGKTLGSHLLYNFLQEKTTDIIYLIDSKRNPHGIKELKKMFSRVLIIGVHADFLERVSRYTLRQREFDTKKGIQQSPTSVFMHEEDVFNISKAIALSDVIIENSEILPYEIEMKIFHGLVNNKFINIKYSDNTVGFPKQKTGTTITEPVLDSKEISILLDKFYAKNNNKNIFVIQGGNRYMSSYLSAKKNCVTNEIKLLDLGKIKFYAALSTLLSASERVSLLSRVQKKYVLKYFKKLTKNKQKTLNEAIIQHGFTSLFYFLDYASVGEIIRVFCNFTITTPFTYPADDRKIRKEFKTIIDYAQATISNIEEKNIIKILLNNTKFYNILAKSNKKTAFLDDVFYRGRTYYAVLIITLILDIPQNDWLFYTLCGDRISNHINTARIKILKKVLYPFENHIWTELGYWEEKNNFFEFRDLKVYHDLLAISSNNIDNTDNVIYQWKKIVDHIMTKLKLTERTPINRILIEFYLFCKVHKININLSAIIDQRAKTIGYCIPYIKLLSVWINQGEMRWKRQTFKNKILNNFEKVNSILNNKHSQAEAAKFYMHNKKIIDLDFLNSFLNENKNGTRECEVKVPITEEKESKRIIKILLANGFKSAGEQLETDFVPDTKDFLCRKNKLILRFRKIKKANKVDILLTLKIGKTTDGGFQDARELQYYFSNIQSQVFKSINVILKKSTDLKLPYKVHNFNDLSALRLFLANYGFPSLRTLVEKKRTTYCKDDRSVTFDVFPQKIGKYLEIETQTPEDLNNMIGLLKIKKNQIELRDYGDIVKSKKIGLSEDEQRTTLF